MWEAIPVLGVSRHTPSSGVACASSLHWNLGSKPGMVISPTHC